MDQTVRATMWIPVADPDLQLTLTEKMFFGRPPPPPLPYLKVALFDQSTLLQTQRNNLFL